MNPRIILPAVLAAATYAGVVAAAVPTLIPIQGFLTDSDQRPVDRSVQLTVRFFEGAASTAVVYMEEQTVVVDQGVLVTEIGGVQALDSALFASADDLWVELSVDGDAMPRFSVGATPYALVADHALTSSWDGLTGVPADLLDGDDVLTETDVRQWCFDQEPELRAVLDDDYVAIGTPLVVPDGAVTAAKLADDAVSTRAIADGAVNEARIATDAVTRAKIADNAVDTARINDRAITTQKIAPAAVGGTQLQSSAISSSHIALGAVNQGHIRSRAVGSTQIAFGAVDASQIADRAVTNAKLGVVPTEYCVLTGTARVVTNQRLCALNRIPNNVECRIRRSGTTFTLYETPSGPNNCCMFCL